MLLHHEAHEELGVANRSERGPKSPAFRYNVVDRVLSALKNYKLPARSIWLFVLHVLPLTSILLVANSTPIVDFDSRLNSLRVKREIRFDLPTPESPTSTTLNK